MNHLPSELLDTQARNLRSPEHLHAQATIDFRFELVRKGIHLCSLSIPVVYYFISKELALTLLVPIAAAFLAVDLARYYHEPTRAWFQRWFGWLLRKHESHGVRKRLTGATNILLSAIACVLIFPKIIAVNAFAILIISDITSALVGRRFGRRPFLNKSREGAIGFLVSAAIVVILAPKAEGLPLEYAIWLLAAPLGAIVESLSATIDDNVTIPLSIGVVTWALYALLLPGVDLFSIR